MFDKIKTIKIQSETAQQVIQNLGLALMVVATTAGLVDFADHKNPGRDGLVPQVALIGERGQTSDSNPLRREREESGPHYVSYSTVQRTPGRTRYYS